MGWCAMGLTDATTLVAIGLGVFVAVALSIFFLARDRKAKDLDKLGPAALRKEFEQQREDRR